MKNKAQLDLAVAALLNTKRAEVSSITALFCMELMNALIDDGEVNVSGFGRFKLVITRGSRAKTERLTKGSFKKGEARGEHLVAVEKKFTVHFKKATPFRERLHRKYGKAPVV